MNGPETLKTGGDPRALPDYIALRDELAKLSHPARPDVDWPRVEQRCLSLFRQNGVELQTAVWYTLASTHLTGLYGLNQGLAILETLLTRQWDAMWPRSEQARIKILAGFIPRLQSLLRTLTPQLSELPQVYQAERHLKTLCNRLQRLEWKNASQAGDLSDYMHKVASRLEKEKGDVSITDNIDKASPAVSLPAPLPDPPDWPLVSVARQEQLAPKPVGPWKSFIAGMLTMLVLGAAAEWGWRSLCPVPDSPIPAAANQASLKALAQLSPLWRQQYGFALAARAKPEASETLKAQWRQHIVGHASPHEALTGWHQGMEGLREMTRRLNALDARKGKYLTGSELKTMVFAITQDFERAVPLEEQLYQMSQSVPGKPLPERLRVETDMHFNQLLNRYMLIGMASPAGIEPATSP